MNTENSYWLVPLTIGVLATLASVEGNLAQQHIAGSRPPTSFKASTSNTESVNLKALLVNSAAAATTNWFFGLTNNHDRSLLFRPPRASLRESRLSTNLPAPGVYEAAPYKCLVVVPGAQQDDRCIIGLGAAQSRMLTITPDLELTPRNPK